MTREELKTLGLTDEQTEAIMKSHGMDIEKLKAFEEKFNTSDAENKSLKEAQKGFESQIKDLTEKVKGNADLEAKVKEMTESLEKQKSDFEQKVKTMKIDSAVDAFVASHKARNAKAVKSLIDMAKVNIGEDGKVSGLDEQWETIYKGNEYMFEGASGNGDKGGLGGGDNHNQSKGLSQDFKDLLKL